MISIEEALKQTGLNLKECRKEKEMSVETLAEKAQLSLPYLKRIEEGEEIDFKVDQLITLAEILKVDYRKIMVDRIT